MDFLAGQMNTDELLRTRDLTHGHFEDTADVAQLLKRVVRARSPYWHSLSAVEQEAIEMIMTKVARILCAKVKHHDSWADIAGYATLATQGDPNGR
jgi:hypothetical protein